MNSIRKLLDDLRNKHVEIYRGALAIAAALIILFLYPATVSFNYEYYPGSPWQNEDLLAPFDFAILKTDAEINAEKEEIVQSIAPVYTKDYIQEDKSIEGFDITWIDQLASLMLDELNADYLEDLRYESLSKLKEVYDKGVISIDNTDGKPSQDGFVFLELEEGGQEREVNSFYTLFSALEAFNSIELDSSKVNVNHYQELLEQTLTYNILFNQSKSELVIEDALSSIPLYKGKIEKGTIVIERGEIVNAEKNDVLESLKMQYNSKMGTKQDVWMLILSSFIFVLILLWITYKYLERFIQSIIFSQTGWSFILLIYILVVALVKVTVYDNAVSQFLVPMLVFPLIIRAFFELRLALFIHIISVLLTASLVPNPYEFIVLQIVAGLIVLFSLKNLRRRSQFFTTALIIFGAYTLIYLSIELYKVGDIAQVNWIALRFFAINAALTLLTYPLIYLFEKIFGFTSDLTLIEMTDMNNKLLRDLAEKAPGTFQHSLQVASMAEAAIHKIGGNELLVRVGALYHDIGKMNNPMFFIENQVHGINPHDELSYDESSQIIIQHVLDGIQLAKKNNIPDKVIDFIRTHHGMTRVEYFYRKYKAEYPDDDIDLSLFTYPGPKPYSKETAVLMMADGVEAASRSMKEYNSESIENLVHGIVDYLIANNQFINASITFSDISLIKKMFINMLINVYHVRVEYPQA